MSIENEYNTDVIASMAATIFAPAWEGAAQLTVKGELRLTDAEIYKMCAGYMRGAIEKAREIRAMVQAQDAAARETKVAHHPTKVPGDPGYRAGGKLYDEGERRRVEARLRLSGTCGRQDLISAILPEDVYKILQAKLDHMIVDGVIDWVGRGLATDAYRLPEVKAPDAG